MYSFKQNECNQLSENLTEVSTVLIESHVFQWPKGKGAIGGFGCISNISNSFSFARLKEMLKVQHQPSFCYSM